MCGRFFRIMDSSHSIRASRSLTKLTDCHQLSTAGLRRILEGLTCGGSRVPSLRPHSSCRPFDTHCRQARLRHTDKPSFTSPTGGTSPIAPCGSRAEMRRLTRIFRFWHRKQPALIRDRVFGRRWECWPIVPEDFVVRAVLHFPTPADGNSLIFKEDLPTEESELKVWSLAAIPTNMV